MKSYIINNKINTWSVIRLQNLRVAKEKGDPFRQQVKVSQFPLMGIPLIALIIAPSPPK